MEIENLVESLKKFVKKNGFQLKSITILIDGGGELTINCDHFEKTIKQFRKLKSEEK